MPWVTARRNNPAGRTQQAIAEALWLGLDLEGALERVRATFRAARLAEGQRWALADTALWMRILGERIDNPEEMLQRLAAAHRYHITGQTREAADAWSKLGCPYEQANDQRNDRQN